MNENTSNEVALEVMAPSALEALERAQVDVQIATAHRYPRSLEQFRKRAINMVSTDVEVAESCIYSRPVGNGKVVEGESIRMAEIVAACYGNVRFGARIIEQTERYVKAEGFCHDLESNSAGKSEAMESTIKRDGTPYDERMRIVVAKACLSKALRDSIFRIIPKSLCKSISEAAKKVIAGQSKTLEQRRTAAKQWLAQIKVDDARAFAVLNVQGWSEVGEEHLVLLTGLKTAMKDNEITLHEAFPSITEAKTSDLAPKMPPAGPPPSAPKPANAATGEVSPVVCKYCNESVANLAAHFCEGLEAAVAGKPANNPPQITEPLPTTPEVVPAEPPPNAPDNDAVKSIELLAQQSGVSLKAVWAFCLKNKLAKKEQKDLSELATSKLLSIIKSWSTILPEIQKLDVELTA